MKQLRLFLLLTAIIASSLSAQAKKVQLKYKLESGNSFTIIHTMEQEMAQEAMGQSQVFKNTLSTRYLFEVIDIDPEGNFQIQQQIDGLKVKVENDFMNIGFDSDSNEDPPAELKYLANGIHIPFMFKLSPFGEILEITDAEEYIAKVTDASEGDANPMAQMVTGMTSALTSLEGLKGQLVNLFFPFPKEKIKIGNSWSSDSESMNMIKFKNIIENTLVEADKETATIKQAVSIEQMQLAEAMEMEGMTMNYELSGRKEAGHQMDRATGLILKADSVTEISGVISIESPQLPTPMSIPMTIKVTDKVEQKR